MIYEATIKYITMDNDGNDKSKKESFVVENQNLFAEVENALHNEFEAYTDLDVVAIKRSKIKEIVNERTSDDEKIFFATIVDKFYDADKDETTETQYVVALHARDINDAHKAIDQYMKQGMEDMELVGLKCTKYLEVL